MQDGLNTDKALINFDFSHKTDERRWIFKQIRLNLCVVHHITKRYCCIKQQYKNAKTKKG